MSSQEKRASLLISVVLFNNKAFLSIHQLFRLERTKNEIYKQIISKPRLYNPYFEVFRPFDRQNSIRHVKIRIFKAPGPHRALKTGFQIVFLLTKQLHIFFFLSFLGGPYSRLNLCLFQPRCDSRAPTPFSQQHSTLPP